MKIFIAGARSVKILNDTVKNRLLSIYRTKGSVLVGDCYGVDAAVQKFFVDLHYSDVTVFASNGKARYNIGNWKVENVHVSNTMKGFDFYAQKDAVMADQADYGFMIWDGRSKGTLNNMLNLVLRGKKVLVYLSACDKMYVVGSQADLENLLKICPSDTWRTYRKLIPSGKGIQNTQLSFLR